MHRNKILIVIALFIPILLFNSSCIKSDYHWDSLNKDGIINIPSIPLGSFEAAFFEDLDLEIIESSPLPTITFKYTYTLRNLFDRSTIKYFFHNYMKNDFKIEGKLHMFIFGEKSDFKVGIDFEVIDYEENKIENVDIKGIEQGEIIYGIQDLAIIFPKEAQPYLKDAKHLRMSFTVTTPRHITITPKDYLKLDKLVMKTAGVFVDL